MSTLNNYIIYQCSVCKRQTEIKNDSRRPDPVRCIITYKCRGRLSRVGTSNGKKFLITPPVAGLQDYIQRGTVISEPTATIENPSITLDTSALGMFTIACLTRTELTGAPPTGTHAFSILDASSTPFVVDVLEADNEQLGLGIEVLMNLFPISPSLIQSTAYTYLVSGVVQVIEGPDDSPSAIVLLFNSANTLAVYVNGVLLDPSFYDRTVDNRITLTPAIYESNNVIQIIVYNDLTPTIHSDVNVLITLSFKMLDPTIVADAEYLSNSAWGDHEAVIIPGLTLRPGELVAGQRYLMHCVDLSPLSQDTSYGIASLQGVSSSSMTSGSFVTGQLYKIMSINDTDFTLIGATLNLAGQIFTATGPGIGSGTAAPVKNLLPSEVSMLLARNPYGSYDKELNAYLSGSSQNLSLLYSQDQITGEYQLSVTESNLTQLLHSLVPSVEQTSSLFATPSLAGTASPAPALVHKYILGPT